MRFLILLLLLNSFLFAEVFVQDGNIIMWTPGTPDVSVALRHDGFIDFTAKDSLSKMSLFVVDLDEEMHSFELRYDYTTENGSFVYIIMGWDKMFQLLRYNSYLGFVYTIDNEFQLSEIERDNFYQKYGSIQKDSLI